MSDYLLGLTIAAFAISLLPFLPLLPITHWSVRIFDYIRIQYLFVQCAVLIAFSFMIKEGETIQLLAYLCLWTSILYQISLVAPYLAIYRLMGRPESTAHSISMISLNVLQKNSEYQRTIKLIRDYQPDLILTMESNAEWDSALQVLEADYPYHHKIPLENRYGMHLYSRLETVSFESHFLISEDRPSIKAEMVDQAGNEFIFWGVHPPPPSPTEMPTSRQKDAELVKLAKLIRAEKAMTIVAGDFNNVCWSKASKLFARISQLKDARKKNGVHPSFPVKPILFRFPLDLLFHSEGIQINQLKTLEDVGSDHLPIFAQFTLVSDSPKAKKDLPKDLKQESKKIIEEGKEAVFEEEE